MEQSVDSMLKLALIRSMLSHVVSSSAGLRKEPTWNTNHNAPNFPLVDEYNEAFSPGYFLPQQGIVSMFFSGVRRLPISGSPVLFLASKVWITWLQCCRLCKRE